MNNKSNAGDPISKSIKAALLPHVAIPCREIYEDFEDDPARFYTRIHLFLYVCILFFAS